MAKEYNYVYDKLVDSEDDIHGIISYSVYKRQKIQFIKDFQENHNTHPDNNDLQQFNDLSRSDAQLDFYRNEASALTLKFLENVLESDLKEREDRFSRDVHDALKGYKPNHWFDIFKSAIGSFVFVLLTGVLYFSIWSLTVSPKAAIEQVFDVKIISNTAQQKKD